MLFADLSKSGIHHKHCSPHDNPPTLSGQNTPGSWHQLLQYYSLHLTPREVGRDDEIRKESTRGSASLSVSAPRKPWRFCVNRAPERLRQRARPRCRVKTWIHQHCPLGISSAGRKSLMSSPQSPQIRLPAQLPNRVQQQQECRLSQAVGAAEALTTQDPKARN
ncbi:B-cell lymphoma 6 protein homolog [Lates japonicus]|uniref:B-cell lymphoma 6 protein homolog n=1 Tax=Lates japonicus TaxID=270547 RepID=A0AAD3NJ17_LATJO|nr:B-cell lymphoma 6 protein homolog [Lates japonicus]